MLALSYQGGANGDRIKPPEAKENALDQAELAGELQSLRYKSRLVWLLTDPRSHLPSFPGIRAHVHSLFLVISLLSKQNQYLCSYFRQFNTLQTQPSMVQPSSRFRSMRQLC